MQTQNKTQTQQATQTKKQAQKKATQTINMKLLKERMELTLSGLLYARAIIRKGIRTQRQLSKETMELAISIHQAQKRWHKAGMKKLMKKEIYEMTLAIAAATLKPMLILAEIHKDIMLESDLMRLTTSDISMMETMIGITQGLEYTEMYL